MDLGQRGGAGKLEVMEGGETVLRIYCRRKGSIFNTNLKNVKMPMLPKFACRKNW